MRLLAPSLQVLGRLKDPLVLVRMGLCLVLLVRHEDFLRGIVAFEHYTWGPGQEFGPQSLARVAPHFYAPLLPGLDVLLPWSASLCRLRLALTLLLLVGVFPRMNALLLGLVSLGLFAADGFRYVHHLFLLYVSVLLLAFDHGKSSEKADVPHVPFALLVLRSHVQVVYLAAGLAKLSATWLSGRTLQALGEAGFVGGWLYEAGVEQLGHAGLAIGACATELLAPLLLVHPRTRAVGSVLAVTLHAFVHETMLVSTFGATMVVLLLAWLPCEAERRGRHRPVLRSVAFALAIAAVSPLTARALGTGVGSYSMFTRLVRYQLDLDVDGRTFPRQELAIHLGRDGARIIRQANGHGIGETNVHILRDALPELGALVCELRRGARHVRAVLSTQRIEGGPRALTVEAVDCPIPPPTPASASGKT